MNVPPITLAVDFLEVSSIDELFRSDGDVYFSAGKHRSVRSELDVVQTDAIFMSLGNAKVYVGSQDIVYMTKDYHYIPQLYPKPWPYAKYFSKDKSRLVLKSLDEAPITRIEGTFVMPFSVAGNWFHKLFDDYARLYFLDLLPDPDSYRIALPFWAIPSDDYAPESDRQLIHGCFLRDRDCLGLEPGVYEIERLIVPPLATAGDYFLEMPTKYVSNLLRRKLVRPKFHHMLRLLVSRADIKVRNLSNEPQLAHELRHRGFSPVCPGDYSFIAQLELYAAAQIVIGVHGLGFAAMISAQNCRALLEFEAAGWGSTPYRALACILGMEYHKMPCTLLEYRNPKRFDWLAEADLPATLQIVDRYFEDA